MQSIFGKSFKILPNIIADYLIAFIHYFLKGLGIFKSNTFASGHIELWAIRSICLP